MPRGRRLTCWEEGGGGIWGGGQQSKREGGISVRGLQEQVDWSGGFAQELQGVDWRDWAVPVRAGPWKTTGGFGFWAEPWKT